MRQRAANGAPTGRCGVGVESVTRDEGHGLACMDGASGFRVELLGPIEAWVDGRQVALGGQRPRVLLAVLALMRVSLPVVLHVALDVPVAVEPFDEVVGLNVGVVDAQSARWRKGVPY